MFESQKLLIIPPHYNSQLFADHFLDVMLPRRAEWQAMLQEAEPVLEAISTLFASFVPSNDEAQTEKDLIRPVLDILGFTYEVQGRLQVPGTLQRPDYIFFVDDAAKNACKNTILDKTLPDKGGYAVGDAKYWRRPLDSQIQGNGPDNRNPMLQIYWYILHSGVEWGLLTNGKRWRLVHRDTADKLDIYYEVDLEELIRDGDVARFLYFYVFFRRAAFMPGPLSLHDLLVTSTEYALGLSESVKEQVYDALRHVAQGFLDNKRNQLTTDSTSLEKVFDNSLILLYRLIFILYAEARGLLPVNENKAYREIYSLHAIKQKLDEGYYLPGSVTLWCSLNQLFFDIDHGNPPLNIATFNGGLFDPEKHEFLESHAVGDAHLQAAIDKLARVDGEFIDYRDLAVRHMGTIYEGLLEFRLCALPVPEEGWSIALINDKGERKTSGSYYTPDNIVKYIIERAIEPVLQRATEKKKGDADKLQAVLNINVLDPAMGSGHFLVEATEYIARKLVDMTLTADDKEQEEAELAYWKRRVVQSCIYGVDLNPLAVELAKLSLWLTTVAKDRPLSFLDHHLRPGNSLVGARLEHLQQGKKKNGNGNGKSKTAKLEDNGQASLLGDDDFTLNVNRAVKNMWLIENSEALVVSEVKEQEKMYNELRHSFLQKYSRLLNLDTATRFGISIDNKLHKELVEYIKSSNSTGFPAYDKILAEAEEIAARELFFHWELEFPEIFFDNHGRPLGRESGFEVVVGNPPWERMKLQQNEFFAKRDIAIAHAPRGADRKRLIKELPTTNPELWRDYQFASERAELISEYAHNSGFYPLMGRGDTNYYALFAERALQLVLPDGRVGLLTPSGIATDDTTKEYFQQLITKQQLCELLDFENKKNFFREVHSSFKFNIILMSGEDVPQDTIKCGFFLHTMEDIDDPECIIMMTPADFRLFNPNTLTSPIFRRRRDADLTRKIYEKIPVLVNKELGEIGNPWGVSFHTLFHMTNDSDLFKTSKELVDEGFWLGAGNVYTKGQSKYLPLYEGKMVQMYDHRAASVRMVSENLFRPSQTHPSTVSNHENANFYPFSHYWVPYTEVINKYSLIENQKKRNYLHVFRDITAPTNKRSFISTIIPFSGVGNTMPIINTAFPQYTACLLSNINSFALDYIARQKIGGQHLTYFYIEQLPILPPATYDGVFQGVKLANFIRERVLELCYTAHDLRGFAEDMGYEGAPFVWDEERRLHLRCQLDALYFHLYGLTREEAGDILDTFPIVQRLDEEQYGKYRTKEMIMAYHTAYSAGNMDAWVQA